MSEPTPQTPPAPAPDAAALAAARLEGATAERQRIAGILGLPEAADRTKLAIELAVTPNLSAEDAKRLLAAQPVTGASAAKEFYGAVKASGGQPRVVAADVSEGVLAAATDSNAARAEANIERQRKALTGNR